MIWTIFHYVMLYVGAGLVVVGVHELSRRNEMIISKRFACEFAIWPLILLAGTVVGILASVIVAQECLVFVISGKKSEISE